MKTFIFTTVFFAATTTHLYGDIDRSTLDISMDSGQNPSKVRLLVLDSQERRTGEDRNGQQYREIPDSYFNKEAQGNVLDDQTIIGNEIAEFNLSPVPSGRFEIQLYSVEASKVAIDLTLRDVGGVANPITGPGVSYVDLSTGELQRYSLTVDPTPGAPPPTLVEMESNDAPVLPVLACVEKEDRKDRRDRRYRGHRRRRAFEGRKEKGRKDGYVAVFGYENKNSAVVEIPVGPDNGFSPTPQDRGQTEAFNPGLVKEAFEVPFEKNETMTWTVKGPDGQVRTVAVGRRSPECR